MSGTESKLIVFAKAPVPGTVKTRLQPIISATDAARLQAIFIEHTLSLISGLENVDIEMQCFPDVSHPVFQHCTQQSGIALKCQQGEDLGERMANAIQDALSEYQQVVVIGTDCPELEVPYLKDAFSRLRQGCDAVIGPANDGGYVLIGLCRFSVSLFTNINWGTDRVLFDTREKLRSLNWKWDELHSLRDVDRPDDLIHFPSVMKEAGIILNGIAHNKRMVR